MQKKSFNLLHVVFISYSICLLRSSHADDLFAETNIPILFICLYAEMNSNLHRNSAQIMTRIPTFCEIFEATATVRLLIRMQMKKMRT